MISTRRLLTGALAFPLVLLGHDLGYTLAGASDLGHSHMAVLARIALFAVPVAMVTVGVRIVRRLPSLTVRFSHLLAAQALGYVALEVVERSIGHESLALLSPAVFLGLLAQVPLAAVVARLGTSVVEAFERAIHKPATVFGPPPALAGPPSDMPSTLILRMMGSSLSWRGPPQFLVI